MLVLIEFCRQRVSKTIGLRSNRLAREGLLYSDPTNDSDRILTRGLRMTIGAALKIGLGVVCFAIGAACLIGAICILFFISASDAAAPGMFGVFAATFLLFAFLLLRQVRWHND